MIPVNPECAICREPVSDDDRIFHSVRENGSIVQKCNVIFHRQCWDRWTDQNPSCPYCRAPMAQLTPLEREYFETEYGCDWILSHLPRLPPLRVPRGAGGFGGGGGSC